MTSSKSLPELDFSKDNLDRQPFADRLIQLSSRLAAAPSTPAGRVIAVDAPWGSGKSWVAARLPAYFKSHKDTGECIYIDAFQFDFHQDPFAVLVSAILKGLESKGVSTAAFKNAAKDVILSALPALAKGVAKAAAKSVGMDASEIVGALTDGAAESSEKVVEKMLESFSEVQSTANAFRETLTKLVTKLDGGKPLVIVIDELDRCRPSFALELLERVKHLFDVPQIVFIFFMHTPALHSAIKKTYGNDINPAEYLRKFVSLRIGLPAEFRTNLRRSNRPEFVQRFYDAKFPSPSNGTTREANNFRDAVIHLAPFFKASLRDIENVVLIWNLLSQKEQSLDVFIAYALLVRVTSEERFSALRNRQDEAFSAELIRFGEQKTDNQEHSYIDYFREVLRRSLNATKFGKVVVQSRTLGRDDGYEQGLRDFLQALDAIDLEYVKL
jgi:KAP family P-loop domain